MLAPGFGVVTGFGVGLVVLVLAPLLFAGFVDVPEFEFDFVVEFAESVVEEFTFPFLVDLFETTVAGTLCDGGVAATPTALHFPTASFRLRSESR